MKHLGLFEGIGGFSLAARWAGWETVAWCEWNEFGQKVLRYHFPEAEGHGDITKTDFTKYANRIDVLTGGFPCQPFSLSGEMEGENDERFMFPEMFRAIREIKPRWIVAENVYGLLSKKFAQTFEGICSQMETEGYQVFPIVIPASAIGAPHQRDRLWIIAYSDSKRVQTNKERNFCEQIRDFTEQGEERKLQGGTTSNGKIRNATNSNGDGLPVGIQKGFKSVFRKAEPCPGGEFTRTFTENYWRKFPTQSPIHNRNDGLSDQLAGLTLSEWRTEGVKAAGNAIVPQVAYEIFKAINEYERLTTLTN